MTRKPPRSRGLSKEDQALWESTAASLEPLKAKRARVHAAVERAEEPHAAGGKAEPKAAPRLEPEHPVRRPAPSGPPPRPPPGLNRFDPKAERKLKRGRAEIEARIDLHGMRQGEAHATLRRFLHASFARGHRWVLVITGKGASAPRTEAVDWERGSERGVLKRNVPLWLADADLRAIIVSYTTASPAHGGEGALYVHLRNPERMRGR